MIVRSPRRSPKQNHIPSDDASEAGPASIQSLSPNILLEPLLAAGATKHSKPEEPLISQNLALPWRAQPEKDNSLDYQPVQPQNLTAYMKEMLDWNRPNWDGHWPPFKDYEHMDYDPNRWEEFDYDYRFYTSGHHRLSNKVASNPIPYKPFPDYNSPSYKTKWKGEYVPCEGPRGVPLNMSSDDEVRVYRGVPASFPKVFAGGYDAVGLDGDVCFDRYSRYGPYGFGDDVYPEDVEDWIAPGTVPEWHDVPWGALQDDCLERNKERYRPEAQTSSVRSTNTALPDAAVVSSTFAMPTAMARGEKGGADGKETKKYHHRTAVLIRAWTGYRYEPNDILAIRATISELSLRSGAEYSVYLLVHVKDASLDIFANETLYNATLNQNVPYELRSIALLWSERIFPEWYPDVGDWQVYWQQFMCLQWFSLTHPGFDYVWNWEMDARYTGHHYHFLSAISSFAEKQPRKLLWERNKRFYLPSVHGSYKEFVESTHADVLNASAHSLIPPPVWGPRPYEGAVPRQVPLGPAPPRTFEEDRFEWGVGEPADFISLLPMWDPRNTSWSYKDKIWNYIPSVRPVFTPEDPPADAFTHPNFTHIDRRVFINTVTRFSKKLLHAMHEENRAGRSMQAEMWPSSVALQHGLKAVYAPHPIFNDRHWPPQYAAAIFDTANTVDALAGGPVEGVQGAWTEQEDSPYNHDREANFQGWSWYFSSRFPRTLYRRWLGWRIVRQDWGEEERVVGGKGSDGNLEERRMCMPGMLLHPIKRMGEDIVRA
ncbi:hypothetical protein N0V90_008600 [Kalmusia sp. IMI 367209]|nr:hypothetical protein N0V90_008600 [Kalmusia sp. IMI 367209]